MDQVEASMCEVTKLQGQEANFTKDVAANLAEIGKPGRDRGDLSASSGLMCNSYDLI